jgi:hypothetical protein
MTMATINDETRRLMAAAASAVIMDNSWPTGQNTEVMLSFTVRFLTEPDAVGNARTEVLVWSAHSIQATLDNVRARQVGASMRDESGCSVKDGADNFLRSF